MSLGYPIIPVIKKIEETTVKTINSISLAKEKEKAKVLPTVISLKDISKLASKDFGIDSNLLFNDNED